MAHPERHVLRDLLVGLLGVIAVAAPVRAADSDPVVFTGEVETGYQFVSDDFDSATFDRYRDETPGLIGKAHFLLEDADGHHFLRAYMDALTDTNQEYFARGGRYGVWDVELGMSQFFQTFSGNGLSPYLGNTTQSLPSGWDFGNPLLTELTTFSTNQRLKFRQRDYSGGLSFWPREDVLLSGGYNWRDRDGTRPGAIQWGSAGGNFVNFGNAVDDDTHNWGGGGALLRSGWNLDFDYRGSWYDNDARSLTVDDPLTAGATGRTARDPDNTAHNFSMSGSVALPGETPARFSGTVAYGLHRQDDSFLPFSTLASPALPESSLDGKVDTLLANLLFTARPRAGTSVKARYRFYDYDNSTDTIVFPDRIRNDSGGLQGTGPYVADPQDYRRQTATLTASQRLTSKVKGSAELEWDNWYREDGNVGHLNDYVGKFTLDYRPRRSIWLRSSYEYRTRDGNSYSESTAGLRNFDQADRTLQTVDASATLYPVDPLSVTATGQWIYSNFDNDQFGLDALSGYNAGIDLGYRLSERVSSSAYYTYYRSRNTLTASSGGGWTGRNQDHANDVGVLIDWALLEQLTAEFGYQYHWGKAETRANGAAGAAEDYPSIKDNLSVISAMFDYRLLDNVRLRAGYRFERWNGTDFRFDDLGLIPPQGSDDVEMANNVDDYEAHIIVTSVVYEF